LGNIIIEFPKLDDFVQKKKQQQEMTEIDTECIESGHHAKRLAGIP
jgi:hypothetical protein